MQGNAVKIIKKWSTKHRPLWYTHYKEMNLTPTISRPLLQQHLQEEINALAPSSPHPARDSQEFSSWLPRPITEGQQIMKEDNAFIKIMTQVCRC